MHIAEQIANQDNACTAHPIFLVEKERIIYGIADEYTDEFAFILGGEAVCEEHWPRIEEAYQANLPNVYLRDDPDNPDEPTLVDDFDRVGIKREWEFVQPFITRAAADAFIAENSHRYGKMRVMVDSGYRNPEWQMLRELPAQLDVARQRVVELTADHITCAHQQLPCSKKVARVMRTWHLEMCCMLKRRDERVAELEAERDQLRQRVAELQELLRQANAESEAESAPEWPVAGCYIYSRKHSKPGEPATWWQPDGNGYCWRLENAGIYPADYQVDGDQDHLMPVELARRIAYSNGGGYYPKGTLVDMITVENALREMSRESEGE